MGEKKKRKPLTKCPYCGNLIGNIERNVAVVREREAGATLEAIAKKYGVTRSRVHAICAHADKWKELAQ